RRTGLMAAWACVLLAISLPGLVCAQAPTIETSGALPTAPTVAPPGSMQSLLGPMPGSTGGGTGLTPGRDEILLGRIGAAGPRGPTGIGTPGGEYQGPPPSRGVAAPQPLPAPRAPFYGTLEMPAHEAEEGPPGGLTLDEAINLLVRQNLNLRAKQLELPQA